MSGELAALITATCWAGTALAFAGAGRRIGSRRVNLLRLVVAVPVLAGLVAASGLGCAVPPRQAVLLAASAIAGLVAGDAAYFEALVRIGPRRASLLMTLAPGFAALTALIGLGNPLGGIALLGMAITLGGVAVVLAERAPPALPEAAPLALTVVGLALGIAGAAGQGVGIVLAKAGLGMAPADSPLGRLAGPPRDGLSGVELAPLLGTLVRMAVGLAALGTATALRKLLTASPPRAPLDRRGLWLTGAGALMGPVLGVWMSMVAVSRTHAAVASTIMATSPVLVIPLAAAIHGERAGPRAVLGAVVAASGVAILAWRDEVARALGW